GAVLVELVRYDRCDYRIKDWRERWGTAHYGAVLLWQTSDKDSHHGMAFVPLGEAKAIDRTIRTWHGHAQAGTVHAGADTALRPGLVRRCGGAWGSRWSRPCRRRRPAWSSRRKASCPCCRSRPSAGRTASTWWNITRSAMCPVGAT